MSGGRGVDGVSSFRIQHDYPSRDPELCGRSRFESKATYKAFFTAEDDYLAQDAAMGDQPICEAGALSDSIRVSDKPQFQEKVEELIDGIDHRSVNLLAGQNVSNKRKKHPHSPRLSSECCPRFKLKNEASWPASATDVEATGPKKPRQAAFSTKSSHAFPGKGKKRKRGEDLTIDGTARLACVSPTEIKTTQYLYQGKWYEVEDDDGEMPDWAEDVRAVEREGFSRKRSTGSWRESI